LRITIQERPVKKWAGWLADLTSPGAPAHGGRKQVTNRPQSITETMGFNPQTSQPEGKTVIT
jgi:hypothetical protein